MLKICKRFLGFILVAAFVTVLFFGLNMGMDTSRDGMMSGCMFDQSATCPMDYQGHVNHWQGMFTAVRRAQNDLLALHVLIVLGGAAMAFFPLFRWRVGKEEWSDLSQSIVKHREISAKLSNHILQALRKGVLNPRLYDFVKISG